MSYLLSRAVRNLLRPSSIRLACYNPKITALAQFTTKPNERQRGPFYNFKRHASSKGFSKESLYAIAMGCGIFGAVALLNGFLYYREHRYSDSSYHPVYENKPPIKRNQESSSGSPPIANEASTKATSSPPTVKLPAHVNHVIVGAGASGMSAAKAIRSADPLAKILLIAGDSTCGEEPIELVGEEGEISTYPPPYVRPVLSGGLWWRSPERRKVMLNPTGDIRTHSWFYYEPLSFFIEPEKLEEAEEGGICLLRGNPVVSIQPSRHSVTLADGQEVKYDCCLLATGVQPITVPELQHCSVSGVDLVANKRLTYFRNIADYRHLQSVSDELHKTGGRIAVLGSGPLACELAGSLMEARRLSEEEKATHSTEDSSDFHVHQFLGLSRLQPMSDILPPILAEQLYDRETHLGIDVEYYQAIVRAALVDPSKPHDSKIRLTINKRDENGQVSYEDELIVDHIVCALGNVPRTDLAASAGLEVDPKNGGFLVNSEMESREDIYAAGSVASFWDANLQARRRVDHISISEDMGELAGLNMARSASYSKSGKKKNNSEEEGTITTDDYDPLPLARKYQSDIWFNMSKDARFDSVGLIDAENLVTQTFFLKDDRNSAVVFYLHPTTSRLLGVLLWNLKDELFEDSEYAAPGRLNLARKMLADGLVLTDEALMLECVRQFDLPGEIAESYAQLKTLIEMKREEEIAKELSDENIPTPASPLEEKTELPVAESSNSKEEPAIPATDDSKVVTPTSKSQEEKVLVDKKSVL